MMGQLGGRRLRGRRRACGADRVAARAADECGQEESEPPQPQALRVAQAQARRVAHLAAE